MTGALHLISMNMEKQKIFPYKSVFLERDEHFKSDAVIISLTKKKKSESTHLEHLTKCLKMHELFMKNNGETDTQPMMGSRE